MRLMKIFVTLLVLELVITSAAANEQTLPLLNEMTPPTSTEPSSKGWNYCSPPVQPLCSTQVGTFATKPKREECQAEIERYVASVFRYRQCLTKEMERAVLEVNTVVERFRCRLKEKRLCDTGRAEKAHDDLDVLPRSRLRTH